MLVFQRGEVAVSTGDDDAVPGVRVDTAGPEDWARWQAVRLRALAEAPGAFASSHAREAAFGEDEWRRRLASGVRVVASHDGVDIGLAGAHLADGPDEPQVFGMWVDPAWRDRGVGERLVADVLDWARECGHAHVRLWVVADNDPARALYRRAGFVDEPDPATPAPGGCEQAMLHVLDPA